MVQHTSIRNCSVMVLVCLPTAGWVSVFNAGCEAQSEVICFVSGDGVLCILSVQTEGLQSINYLANMDHMETLLTGTFVSICGPTRQEKRKSWTEARRVDMFFFPGCFRPFDGHFPELLWTLWVHYSRASEAGRGKPVWVLGLQICWFSEDKPSDSSRFNTAQSQDSPVPKSQTGRGVLRSDRESRPKSLTKGGLRDLCRINKAQKNESKLDRFVRKRIRATCKKK